MRFMPWRVSVFVAAALVPIFWLYQAWIFVSEASAVPASRRIMTSSHPPGGGQAGEPRSSSPGRKPQVINVVGPERSALRAVGQKRSFAVLAYNMKRAMNILRTSTRPNKRSCPLVRRRST